MPDKELGISRERLQQAVDKVCNSASAVRKELGAPRLARRRRNRTRGTNLIDDA
jgi:hypothetical protein